MRYLGLVFLLTLAVGGCNRNRGELTRALAQAQAASAEKDSLLAEVLETSKFVNDVNAELAKVKNLAKASPAGSDRGAPGAQQDRAARAVAVARVQRVIARLDSIETKLAKSEQRAGSATRRNKTLLAQIDEFKRTIADLKATAEQQQAEYAAVVEGQRQEIASLTGRVDTLFVEKAALKDTVTSLTNYKNTVYLAVGTKDQLKKQGILVEEGSKFLVFGGKSLHPARHLSPEVFAALDKTRDTVIALPREDKNYKLVSRQGLEYADTASVRNGKVHGALHIESPEEFWAASKYLILVQD